MMSTKVNWRRNDRSMKTSHRLPEETPSEYANTVFKKKKKRNMYGFICKIL